MEVDIRGGMDPPQIPLYSMKAMNHAPVGKFKASAKYIAIFMFRLCENWLM